MLISNLLIHEARKLYIVYMCVRLDCKFGCVSISVPCAPTIDVAFGTTMTSYKLMQQLWLF